MAESHSYNQNYYSFLYIIRMKGQHTILVDVVAVGLHYKVFLILWLVYNTVKAIYVNAWVSVKILLY